MIYVACPKWQEQNARDNKMKYNSKKTTQKDRNKEIIQRTSERN